MELNVSSEMWCWRKKLGTPGREHFISKWSKYCRDIFWYSLEKNCSKLL